jgi:hypothetical protein
MSGLADALRQLRLPDARDQELIEAAAARLDQIESSQAAKGAATIHAIEGLRNIFRDEKATWDIERQSLVSERDECRDMADKLAQAIADHLLVGIGEHSATNCPWMRALEELQSAGLCSAFDAQQRLL